MALHSFMHSQLYYASFLQSMIQGYMNFSVTILLALYFVMPKRLICLGISSINSRDDHNLDRVYLLNHIPSPLLDLFDPETLSARGSCIQRYSNHS